MKKVLSIVFVIGIILVTGCGNKSRYNEPIELTYSEYTEKITNKDDFVILLWRTGCSHCETFEPKLNEVIKKYDLEIYSMNMANLSNSEYAKVENKTFIGGTPTTVFIKNGVKDFSIVGDKSEEKLVDFFKEIGYIGD